MTAVCGGGTSSAKDGFDAPIFWTTTAIAAFFNALPTPWIVDFVSYLGPQNIDPSEFCVTDPPPDPGMTALDWAQLVQIANPFVQTAAAFKFAQLFRRLLWFQICQCDTGPQPTPPTPPTPPTGLPVLNPPALGPSYPTGQPCSQFAFSLTGPPSTDTIEATALAPIPSGVTYASIDMVDDGRTLIGAEAYTASMGFYNATTLVGSLAAGRTVSVDTPHIEGAIPAGAIQYNMQRRVNLGSGDPGHFDATYNLFCGTTPSGGGAVPIPCQADPLVQGLLQQILGLVTLIQRQAVPFAYVSGAMHGGLSGDGEFAVEGLIGLRVLVNETGYGAGAEAGDPDALFGIGWINWGNADGWKRRESIGASPMVSMPPVAGQYTRIGYSLRPGAVVTITELVRES